MLEAVRSAQTLRVALDATPLLGARTGVGAFTLHAMEALAADHRLDVRAFALTWRGRRDVEALVPSGVRAVHRPMAARPLRLAWLRMDGPVIERWTGPVDVVHGTNFVVPPSRRAARVVTVHDLTAVRHPQLCTPATLQFPRLLRRAIRRGAWVHTPSAFVAEEVIERLGADSSRVVAIASGVPPVVDADPSTGRRMAGADRYVLTIGTIEPRKDHAALVRAFDRVADRHDDVRLVIAGVDGWATDAFVATLERARHRDRVVRLGYVDDGTRSALLRGATAFAFPSVYEGFGFPPLEAMQVDVPVVATAVGSLPEVLGDAALLVAAGDDEALAHGLERVLDDEGLRAQLRTAGRTRVRSLSWQACAEGLTALYARAST
jgi:glycosyltransferase involved in cell wall biosynthesis